MMENLSKRFTFEFIAHHMTILGDKGKEMWWNSNKPKVLKLWTEGCKQPQSYYAVWPLVRR